MPFISVTYSFQNRKPVPPTPPHPGSPAPLPGNRQFSIFMSPFLHFSSFVTSHSCHCSQIPISLLVLSVPLAWFVTSKLCYLCCLQFLPVFLLLYVHFCFFSGIKGLISSEVFFLHYVLLNACHRGPISHPLHGDTFW